MGNIAGGFVEAARLIIGGDAEFLGTVGVSLLVATSSTVLAAVTGVPLGIFVAHREFPGRNAVMTVLHTLMSLPTVVVGLLVYSFLSRSGPLGGLGLLYTRTAIVIGQWLLAFPIVAGLAASAVKGMDKRIIPTAESLGADAALSFATFLREARFAIVAAVVAAFGRVFAEVGVSMIVGGNIRGYTRTMTTAIALETNKGDFSLAIALGLVLLTVALAVNVLLGFLRGRGR